MTTFTYTDNANYIALAKYLHKCDGGCTMVERNFMSEEAHESMQLGPEPAPIEKQKPRPKAEGRPDRNQPPERDVPTNESPGETQESKKGLSQMYDQLIGDFEQGEIIQYMLNDPEIDENIRGETRNLLDVLKNEKSTNEQVLESAVRLGLPKERVMKMLSMRGSDVEQAARLIEQKETELGTKLPNEAALFGEAVPEAPLEQAEDVLRRAEAMQKSGADPTPEEREAMQQELKDVATTLESVDEQNKHVLNKVQGGREYARRYGRKVVGGVFILVAVGFVAALRAEANALANAGRG